MLGDTAETLKILFIFCLSGLFQFAGNSQNNLGNLVWYDTNNNGVKDLTENGIGGITVRLYKDADADNIPDGGVIATTSTAVGGFYAFNTLPAGNYIVAVVLPAGFAKGGTIASGTNPNNDIDDDNNGIDIVGTEVRSHFISLAPGSEPVTDGDGNNGNLTLDFGIYMPSLPPIGGGEVCFVSETNPDDVSTKITWAINPDGTITIRATLAKTFVDNTYGTNQIGWPGHHFFHHLVTSDQLQLSLYDASNTLRMKFDMDYFSEDPLAPSGYGNTGVTGNDGDMITGNASDVVSVRTSLDVNFNDFGYVLTTNSPATDASYTPDPAFPNWIYDVWYEVTVKGSAFPGGFGTASQTDIHASPSKTGKETEIVVPEPCPTANIGNLVWHDENDNGIKDGIELGMPGLTVHLYNDANNDNLPDAGPVATTVTGVNGLYGFSNLSTGFYIVGVVLPAGFTKSTINGGDPDNDIDLDNNGIIVVGGIVRSNTVTLQNGTEPLFDGDGAAGNLTVDFGIFKPSGIPLPVQLLQFTGTGNGSTSTLNWKVTNETQMKFYVIERSRDGRTFLDASTVNSVNAGQTHDYTFTETNSSNADILYYRLRSVGQNGNISYSPVVALRFGNISKNVFTVYPNPVKNYVVIGLGVTEKTEGIIHLVNKAGQTVLIRALKLNAGSNAITIDGLGKYVNGIYNLNIKLDNGKQYYQTILLAH